MAKNKVKVEYDVDMEKERRKKQQKNGKTRICYTQIKHSSVWVAARCGSVVLLFPDTGNQCTYLWILDMGDTYACGNRILLL